MATLNWTNGQDGLPRATAAEGEYIVGRRPDGFRLMYPLTPANRHAESGVFASAEDAQHFAETHHADFGTGADA